MRRGFVYACHELSPETKAYTYKRTCICRCTTYKFVCQFSAKSVTFLSLFSRSKIRIECLEKFIFQHCYSLEYYYKHGGLYQSPICQRGVAYTYPIIVAGVCRWAWWIIPIVKIIQGVRLDRFMKFRSSQLFGSVTLTQANARVKQTCRPV